MFGTKPKHKIVSAFLLCLAAAVLVNAVLKIYQQETVTVDAIKSLGCLLIMLSIAFIPEFFFLKLSEAIKLSFKSKTEKIVEMLFLSGLLLVIIAFVASIVL